MPRELTPEEIRDNLLDHVWAMIGWWETESRAASPRDKLEGLAFSILAALDGSAADLPAFKVTPIPHPEDKAYNQSEGDDWYPEDQPDLGTLHEFFHSRDPRRVPPVG